MTMKKALTIFGVTVGTILVANMVAGSVPSVGKLLGK